MHKQSNLTPRVRLMLVLGCLAVAALEAPRAAGALLQAWPSAGPQAALGLDLAQLASLPE